MAHPGSTLSDLALSTLYQGYHRNVMKTEYVAREKVCVDGIVGVWLHAYGTPCLASEYHEQARPEVYPHEVDLILRKLQYPIHCVVSFRALSCKALTRQLTLTYSSHNGFITVWQEGSRCPERIQFSTCEQFSYETSQVNY